MNTLLKTQTPDSFFTFITEVTEQIFTELNKTLNKDQSDLKIKEVQLHPGKEDTQKRYQAFKAFLNDNKNITLCAGIYTLISNITKVQPLESEQADVTLQLSAYILMVSQGITLEKRMAFNLLKKIINLINNNRWKLTYVFPANNLKRVDLYGLTVQAKQITGIKGWNPSIQAHAKDLYEDGNDVQPQDLALSLLNWEQTLRVNETIFNQSQAKVNKIIIHNKVN